MSRGTPPPTNGSNSMVANVAATLGSLDGKSLGLGPKLSALFQGMKKLSVPETQSCLQCSKKDVMRLAHNTSEIYCAGCISAVKSSLSSPWVSWSTEPLSGILCECKKKKDVLRMQDDLCYPGVIAGLLQAHSLKDWLSQQRLQPRTGRGQRCALHTKDPALDKDWLDLWEDLSPELQYDAACVPVPQ